MGGVSALALACAAGTLLLASPFQAAQASSSAREQVQQGLASLHAGRFAEAEDEFTAALRASPHWPEVRADLGVSFYADHKYPEAIAAFEQALKEDSSLAAPKALLPLSLAAAGRCEEAEPGLRTAFASAPDPRLRRVSGLSLERCLMQSGKTAETDETTQKLLAAFPNDPDVLYEAGEFYAKLSSNIELRLMRSGSGSARAYQMMGDVAAARQNWNEAINSYRKALRVDPSLQGLHLQIAVLLLTHSPDANAWREALTELNDELRIDPGSAEAEYEIGETYRKHDQPKAALAAFQKSLERDPQAVPTRIGLAKTLQQLGQYRQALAVLRPAEKAADPSVHFLLAQLYRQTGDASSASREQAAFQRLRQNTTQ